MTGYAGFVPDATAALRNMGIRQSTNAREWMGRKWKDFTTAVQDPLKGPTVLYNTVRAYNVFVGVSVLAGYFFTKKANAFEYLGDVGIHALQAGTAEYSTPTMKGIAFALNTVRIVNIYSNGLNQNSTIPTVLNYLDIFNHILNISALIASVVAIRARQGFLSKKTS